MHQLRVLIWKAYKVRLRTPVATLLDVTGPLLIMVIYLCLKLALGTIPMAPDAGASTNLFRDTKVKLLDPKTDLQNLLCSKILFHSSPGLGGGQNQNIRDLLPEKCGIQLVDVKSRQDLIEKLEFSLNKRINFKKNNLNLNKPARNSSQLVAGCFTLPNEQEPSYQAGIVITNLSTYEIFMTDTAQNPILYQPYTQGSSYNEFRLPHSDLNSGFHLFELCLARALDHLRRPTTGGGNSSSPGSTTASAYFGGELKLRIRASPTIAAPIIVPTLFLVFVLLAHLFNALAATIRASEENENGLHHYIRTSGVPATVYWFSQLTIVMIHVSVQSLIIAVLLAVPTSPHLLDPIYEANITMRYLLLLTYGLAIITHAMFIGSILSRVPHSVLVFCILAIVYSLFPNAFLLQWNAYGFVGINKFIEFFLLNPVSNYETLLMVIFALYAQTNEPLNWSQMRMRIIGGGFTEWSIGALWLLLVAQGIFWFVLTIIVDQLYYCSARGPIGLILELGHEFIFCNKFSPKLSSNSGDLVPGSKASKSSISNGLKSAARKDPNRICCSIRHVSVEGPTLTMAHTKGDPLKFKPDHQHQQQAKQEANHNHDHEEQVSKAYHYLINRSKQPNSIGAGTSYSANQLRAAGGNQSIEPIYLDEAIQQHIVWYKTKVAFRNLSLDFRFNQVSFILGQTDLKELFFAALLGLRSIDSGHIVLDGAKFKPNTMSLARPHIGYLGERDIFNQEMSVFENLQFFGSLRDPSYTQFDSESQFVLNLLHLSSRKDNLPQVLTSRSARKLALAAAAVGHTKLLLLVEPTLNLRWRPRCQVLNLLKKYKAIRSIVVDTSDIDEATAFGDRVILLQNSHADLDGTPERLSRKLCCGHWLVFEPISALTASSGAGPKSAGSVGSGAIVGGGGGKGKGTAALLGENIKALEALTSGLFKQDKLDRLDSTKRSVYQDLMKSSGADFGKDNEPLNDAQKQAHGAIAGGHYERHGKRKPMKDINKQAAAGGSDAGAGTDTVAGGTGAAAPGSVSSAGKDSKFLLSHEKLQKTTVVVKVRYSQHSNRALCTLLKMYSPGRKLHGFRLAEITFESLEDVLVLRMSKANYPDLPPDLLLSLQHRTQAYRQLATASERTQSSQVSVRKFTSELQVPKVNKPMFGARLVAIIKDRVTMVREMTIMGTVFLLALLIVAAHLWALRLSIEPELREVTEANWLTRRRQLFSSSSSIFDPLLKNASPVAASTSMSSSSSFSSSVSLVRGPAPKLTRSSGSDDLLLRANSDMNNDGTEGNQNHKVGQAKEQEYDNAFVNRAALAGVKEISLVGQLYKNRIAFYVIGDDNNNNIGASVTTPKPTTAKTKKAQTAMTTTTTAVTKPTQAPSFVRKINLGTYIERWPGDKRLTGIVSRNLNESDASFVTNLVQKSKDLLVAIIVLDPTGGEATIVFEPHLPHAMIASIETFINYYFSFEITRAANIATKITDSTAAAGISSSEATLDDDDDDDATVTANYDDNSISGGNESQLFLEQEQKRLLRPALKVLQHNFKQSWHEMLRGHLDRRFFYGLGFSIAEGLTTGALVMAPIRHRSESRVTKVPTTYWLAMGLFDMALSSILILGYIVIIVLFESIRSASLTIWMLFTLFLYKFASIPVAYLVALLVETILGGFLFLFLLTFAVGWAFAIHIKSFIEWTLSGEGYMYTVSSWLIHFIPISSLIETLTNINQVNRIDELCSQVPAYTPTSSQVGADGYNRAHFVDRLLVVVKQCLANGKSGVSMNVFDRDAPFSIIWTVTLMFMFALVTWTFLFFSERVFGAFARRFTSMRTSHDPMKTIIRPATDSAASLFDWDREKDRLVSEYIRCINEAKYVKQMASNCYYLRIWLRPLSDQSLVDKRLALILDPLISLGQPKNELQVELKTTLQLFVRIGSELTCHRPERVQIVEAYSKFVQEHSDIVVKFALVDWTREALYKILLHGYYNTKSKTPLL